MHIGCGPIFLLCWPLYSDAPSAAVYAAAAPLAITAFFSLVGLGLVKARLAANSPPLLAMLLCVFYTLKPERP